MTATSIGRAVARVGETGAEGTKKQLQAEADRESAYYRERAAKRNAVATREITPVDIMAAPKKRELNPALLLDIMHRALMYWARWETPEQADIATLWAASTWFRDLNDILLFSEHPRLWMIAPPGSGKTRVMKLVRAMSKQPTGILKAPVTAYSLRDFLSEGSTVFLDEVQRMVGAGRAHMDAQSILSAYERDTASANSRSGGSNQQNIFGPMMLGAKSQITTTTGGLIDDLFERSFILTPVKHTDEDDPIPDLDEQFDEIMERIPAVLGMWAESERPAKGLLRPIHTVPKALTGRMREISSPLLAVADRAVDPELMETTGQDLRWALRARQAVQSVLLGHGENGDEIIDDLAEKMKGLGA